MIPTLVKPLPPPSPQEREPVLLEAIWKMQNLMIRRKVKKHRHPSLVERGRGRGLRYILTILLLAILPISTPASELSIGEENYSLNQSSASQNLTHLRVQAFCQDSLGYIWIGTARGLNRFNGYEFQQFFHNKQDTLSLDNDMIYSLYLDSSNRLWVGTSTGVNRYDFVLNHFVRYRMPHPSHVLSITEDSSGTIWVGGTSGLGQINEQNKQVNMITNDHISKTIIGSLIEDKIGTLWAGTENGLAYRGTQSKWNLIKLSGERRVTSICVDPQGVFLLGTNAGLALFDPVTARFLDVPEPVSSNKSLSSAYIHFICEIEPLRYLIGTSANGVFVYDALRQTLQHDPSEYIEHMGSREPLCCYVDRQANIWVGSFDNGFAVVNIKDSFFNLDTELSNTFKNLFTTRIIEDRHQNLWVGTRYRGLVFYSKDRKIKRYDSSNSPIFSASNLVEELFIDSNGQLWIACAEHLVSAKIDPSGNLSVTHIIPHSGIGSATITEDQQGNIWFGLASGLFVIRNGVYSGHLEKVYSGNIAKAYILSNNKMLFSVYGEGVFRLNLSTMAVEPVTMPSQQTKDIGRHCIDIFEDSERRVWFGSYNGGVMYMRGDEFLSLGMDDGLPCNDITCIAQDKQGNIWLSTAYGMSRIGQGGTIMNYFEGDGTRGNIYHEKAYLLRSDGQLFFTGNHGLTFFDPQFVIRRSSQPPIVIEDLKIQNESVVPGSKGSVLHRHISFTNKVVLNHRHSVVTIDYSGIEFLTPQKLTYACKLEGFDEQWVHVGNHRRATYSNLKPGNYKFMVKVFNGEGIDGSPALMLDIVVKPAPWNTWYAWLLYTLLLASGIFLFTRFRVNIKLQKKRLELEANERSREREVNEMKMTFYTNISHEFRTPLTLISAPVQQLISRFDPESEDGKLLGTISRNEQRLHRLIDQLLDFRKMEDGMLLLKVKKADLAAEIDAIIDNYSSITTKKKIRITFSPYTRPMEVWYDPDKIEKIMHNLLSNAMKHAPESGQVAVICKEMNFIDIQKRYVIAAPAETYLEVSITDNGPGVPENKMSELFVRYRQIESSTGMMPDYAGSGIGLHYTKKLIESHHGSIIAEIPQEGGMRFSFILPLSDIYINTEKTDFIHKGITDTPDEFYIDEEGTQSGETKKHEYTILVAEDNVELMIYFRQMLGEKYNVIEASNGALAWDILKTECPDLILSDVVMPELSGYDLCSRVKQHPDLSHIPVILLTAKTSMPEQIEGLTHGADAYICKPFNVEYLMLLIGNFLNNRDKLRSYYSTPRSPLAGPEDIPVKLNTLDRKFMDNLTTLMEKELGNLEINVDDIASEMAFSRTSFYRKIKGLTNMAPADFIRNYRLKRAAEMIEEGSWSMSEVAEKTGFVNYNHFSGIFKKQFGVSPKNYKSKS